MKRILALIFLAVAVLSAQCQCVVSEMKAQRLDDWVAAGNYSGLCHVGNGLYAVVDDKSPTDGFYLWEIEMDSTGHLVRLRDHGFRTSDQPNRDGEGICYLPQRGALLISGEADNCIKEYRMDGSLTGRKSVPLTDCKRNSGLESLCWDEDAQCVWAMEENNGQGACRLLQYDSLLNLNHTYIYKVYPPEATTHAQWYAHGVSEILSAGKGRLLVMEREAFVPKKKIGAWTKTKLCLFDTHTQEKQLLWEHRTRLNATARSWANYEGLCWGETETDGTRLLLLLSDSQNRYKGVLHDWIKVLKLKL